MPELRLMGIGGFDSTNIVENITFENLRILGKAITQASDANLHLFDHYHNVQFIPVAK